MALGERSEFRRQKTGGLWGQHTGAREVKTEQPRSEFRRMEMRSKVMEEKYRKRSEVWKERDGEEEMGGAKVRRGNKRE